MRDNVMTSCNYDNSVISCNQKGKGKMSVNVLKGIGWLFRILAIVLFLFCIYELVAGSGLFYLRFRALGGTLGSLWLSHTFFKDAVKKEEFLKAQSNENG